MQQAALAQAAPGGGAHPLIVQRYILREIGLPGLAGLAVLIAVYALYSTTDILSDAVAGRIAGTVVLQLIALRTLIAGEVLLPTALYLAVVWAFVRMDRDSELAVLRASGASLGQLFVPVVVVAVVGAVLVAVLTLQVRPWAFRVSYALEGQLVTADPRTIEPGRFYQVGPHLVLLANASGGDGSIRDVFVEDRRGGSTQVIRAAEMRLVRDQTGTRSLMEFRRGTAYVLSQDATGDRAQEFDLLRYTAALMPGRSGLNQRRARDTGTLAASTRPKDTAELQWRALLPLTTGLMALVSAAVGVGRPRTSIFPRLLGAVCAYAVVFNVAALARTLVEKGTVGAFPGLWWSLLVPVALFAGVWFWRRQA